MSDKVRMCGICRKHPVAQRDYRFIDSCGLQGKVLSCEFCVGLNDVAISQIVREELDPLELYEFDPPETFQIDKKIEIWGVKLTGVWYEVHVDVTDKPCIMQTFAEKGEVTPEVMHRLEKFVEDEVSNENLEKQLQWFNDFADCVQGDHRLYDSACEYADEQEIERYGRDYSGNYSSINHFLEDNELEDYADEVFGEGWEPEDDVAQIQEIAGSDYVVKAIQPTTEREKRMDDYIQVVRI